MSVAFLMATAASTSPVPPGRGRPLAPVFVVVLLLAGFAWAMTIAAGKPLVPGPLIRNSRAFAPSPTGSNSCSIA